MAKLKVKAWRTEFFQLCQLYNQGGWTVTRIPKQGTYMTKGDRWITFSSPEDMREKVIWKWLDQLEL